MVWIILAVAHRPFNLREDMLQQPCFMSELDSASRVAPGKELIQLSLDAFSRKVLDTLGILFHLLFCLLVREEAMLGSRYKGTYGPQGVVRKALGVQGA